MTIDQLGRAAAAEARAAAARTVDPDAMVRGLHRLRRRRTAGSFALGVVAVTALAGGIAVSRDDSAPPPGRPVPGHSTPSTGPCADPDIRCLGGDRYRVGGLPAAVTVALPSTFQPDVAVRSDGIEVYRANVTSTGVSVTEHAVPAKYGPVGWVRDRSAGRTAGAMARWLAHRPFLVRTTLTATTIGSRPAWRVTGDLDPHAELPAPKDGGDVAPAFGTSFNDSSGYRADLAGSFTLLDVPGAGVVVIWSWTLGHGDRALAGNQVVVDNLRFG